MVVVSDGGYSGCGSDGGCDGPRWFSVYYFKLSAL